jgi:RNA polymerase sigma factor (sigma-70 family)
MANRQFQAVLNPPAGISSESGIGGFSDGQLLARFAAHRDEPAEAAFTILVRRHGPMVLRVCEQILGDRHDAEDAFQVTFLVLARRAGSIRQPELLGHWLHGVALRTAREVKMRQLRAKQRESAKAEEIAGETIGAAGPEGEVVCREEFEILHDEVARLPERYRGPVVLCELEGMSYHEAAMRLSCPVSTIGVRLKRARERLRERLIRRGVAPSAGLFAALLCADDAPASVPPFLVESTVQAAMGFAVSKAAAAGLASAGVVAVSDAVLWAMALARLKLALPLAVTIGIGVAAAWIAVSHKAPAIVPSAPQTSGPITAAPPAQNADEPQPDRDRPRDETVASPKRASSALVGRVSLTATPVESINLFPTVSIVTFKSGRGSQGEGLSDSSGARSQPQGVAKAGGPGQLVRDERDRGEMLFAKEWVAHDPMAKDGDGLGPLYNDSSCVACHSLAAPGGAGPESKNVVLVTASSNTRRPPKSLDQIHPGLRSSRAAIVHRYGTDPDYAAWRRRFYESSSESVANSCSNPGLDPVETRIQAISAQATSVSRVRGRVVHLNAAKGGVDLTLSERNAPALFGSGHIDAIPSEVLVFTAQHQPKATRGKVSRNHDGEVSRFGWKAQVATLHEFVRTACANELGLEVPGHAQAVSPVAAKASVKGLDMTDPDCDSLVAYVRALPSPVVIDPDGPLGTRDMREGRRLFADVGCVACHVPQLGDVQGIYSDLLLHDMGPSLSDSGSSYGMQGPISPGATIAQEWRTPPLWGYRDSAPYLHDGRAQNLDEAVALHEGQAKASARLFFTLSSQDRSKVETFLKSLIAPKSRQGSGIIQAAELETRIEMEARNTPEAVVRHRRDEALSRGRKQRVAAQRRKAVLDAAARAKVRLPMAQALEKMGKTAGALDYYRQIASDAPDSEAGRLASARIAVIAPPNNSP